MNRIESITIAPTTERKTAPTRFEAALQGATRSLAASVAGAVELAAPMVPFGTVLAGAVRGAVNPEAELSMATAAGGHGGAHGGGTIGIAATGAGHAGGAHGSSILGGTIGDLISPIGAAGAGGAHGSGGAGSQGDILEATRAMQQEAQAMNLQYLQLQEQMQRESREFTALTNVMKVKHDSARAAISNIH